MRDAHPDLAARGWTVVAVGQGTGARSAGWAREQGLPFAVLGDPERHAYAAFGLRRASPLDMLRPALILAGIRAAASGARQGKLEGDPSQTPGTFVVDRQGIVRHARPGAHAGDLPTAADLLRAVDALPTE